MTNFLLKKALGRQALKLLKALPMTVFSGFLQVESKHSICGTWRFSFYYQQKNRESHQLGLNSWRFNQSLLFCIELHSTFSFKPVILAKRRILFKRTFAVKKRIVLDGAAVQESPRVDDDWKWMSRKFVKVFQNYPIS